MIKGPLGKAVYEFSRDGGSVVIHDPETPRHWYNYLWNDLGYCAQVSQMGHGRSYYLNEKADMCMLDRDAARYVYLRDEKNRRCWNIGGGPLEEAVEDYRCTHSISSTLLESRQGDVEASWQIFVPPELYGELWTVTLENRGKEPKLLSVFPAVSFSLDGFSHPRYYEMYRCLETEFDKELNGMGQPFTNQQMALFGADMTDPALQTPQDVEAYGKLNRMLDSMMPLLTEKYGTADLQASSGEISDTAAFEMGDFRICASFRKKAGVCLVLRVSENGFYLIVQDVSLTFQSADPARPGIDILALEEGAFVQGSWQPGRRLNGDEAVLNTYEGPAMLRVKLFAYP